MTNKMRNLINLEKLASDLRYYESHCDLIKDISKKKPFAHCGGYLIECDVCELPKYHEEVRIQLTKLKSKINS